MNVIARRMKELGLRQVDVADAAGVTRQVINVIVRRGVVPRHDTLESICDILNLDVKDTLYSLHKEQSERRNERD